ncbi:MAG: helix-turn-helix domain-containing protein [Peptococcaceae bacterium]|nr:helix-turn-helix domain-containing protein [Peptococcaceae bacterium]
MKNPNEQKNHLAYNLATLRKQHRLTLEEVAERIGVTRQAVAKWETGESMPDIVNCDALAALYDVSLDDLVHFDQEANGIGVPPKNKHLFGMVQVGERGQIVIPKKARELLGYNTGDMLVVLGDTTPGNAGLALMASDVFLSMAQWAMDNISGRGEKS